MRLMKQGHLRRALALLILSLIFADLISPQLCCEELEPHSSNGTSVGAAGIEENAILTTAPYPEPEQQQEPPATEKGCFCCCAHILQSSVFSADVPAVEWQQTAPIVSPLPLSPPSDKFHPPRLA